MSVEASTFGDRMADVYDELHEHLSTPEYVQPMVDLLAQLGGAGPALELGIGTGRIALPPANRGIEVHGIDASEGMLAKLREKPGGKEHPSRLGTSAKSVSMGATRWSTLFSTPSLPF